MMMNPPLHRKDYRALAGKLDYSWYHVKDLDRQPNPTATLLEKWWSDGRGRTVTDLIELFKKVDRFDVIEELETHEFVVVHPRPTSNGSSTASSFCAKVPVEHSATDENGIDYNTSSSGFSRPSNGRGNTASRYFNGISVENISTSTRLSSSCQSLALSDTASSYQSTLTGSGPCPVEDLDYDTDEELNRKVAEKNRQPCENTVQNSMLHCAQLHPTYLYNAEDEDEQRRGSVESKKSVNMGTMTDETSNFSSRPSSGSYCSTSQTCQIIKESIPSQPSSLTVSDKVALVIGNRYYNKLGYEENQLLYPHRDAYDITAALQELNFKVLSLVDLTLKEMRTAMLAFCKLLGDGVFAVFYFAGHGYEEQGENYLMPVDASNSSNIFEYIAAGEILQEMQLSKTVLNLLIIDACRVRKFDNNKNENTDKPAPSCLLRRGNVGNTIIAYSCSSQSRAWENPYQQNGVYANELLKHIKQDRRIEHILLDVNGAVDENPFVEQRPVFESDTIQDCRLTCEIDSEKNRWLYNDNKTHAWWTAMNAPEPTTYSKSDYNLAIQFTYKRVFSNILEIEVALQNNNPFALMELNIDLLMTTELEKQQQVITNTVEPSPSQPSNSHENFCRVCHFRIRDLQKLQECLLMVLQIQYVTNEPSSCLAQNTPMSPQMSALRYNKSSPQHPLATSCKDNCLDIASLSTSSNSLVSTASGLTLQQQTLCGSRGSQRHGSTSSLLALRTTHNIELKLNANYPLVSYFLKEFKEWIQHDSHNK